MALSRAGGDAPDIDLPLPPAPIALEGDHLRVHQVFVNLIGNATKFTPASGRVWVKATVEGDEAVVRVEDDGMGIAADKLESIFEMSTQASDPGCRWTWVSQDQSHQTQPTATAMTPTSC